MNNTKTTKRALLSSVTAMLICVAMLIGTTFAWFTDSASTAVNKIQAGTLDVQLLDASGNDLNGKTLNWVTSDNKAQSDILWEPGCTYKLNDFKIKNNGNLALKYKIIISGIVGDAELLDVIDFTVTTTDTNYSGITNISGLNNFEGKLGKQETTDLITITGKMQESAGNEYQGLSIDGIGITVVATQDNIEADSFGTDYDATAVYPAAPSIVKAVASGKVADSTAETIVTDTASAVQATIPANTLAANDNVVLTVERKAMTADSVTYDIDFKVNDSTPTLSNPVSVNVNIGAGLKDVVATHNGNAMTKVDNAVNDQEYSYNSETGILTIVTKTFSPFAIEYKTNFAAKIGNIGYATLGKAVEAANDGATVTMLKDVSISVSSTSTVGLTIDKNITFNGNNKTITVTGDYSFNTYGIFVNSSSDISAAVKNVTLNTKGVERAIRFNGSAGGTVEDVKVTGEGVGIHVKGTGEVAINRTNIAITTTTDKFTAHLRSGVVVGSATTATLTDSTVSVVSTDKDLYPGNGLYLGKGAYVGTNAKGKLIVDNSSITADYALAIDGSSDVNKLNNITVNSGHVTGSLGSPGGYSYKEIVINGGTFTNFGYLGNGFYSSTDNIARLEIFGGTFDACPEEKFISDGKEAVNNGSTWTVTAK